VTRVICIQAISHGSDSVGISPVPTPIPHPRPIDDVKERPPVDIIVPEYKEGDDLSDVMDKPILETEGGAIIDISDAAAGSTLGTIALLGAGFLRRRLTGGI
jgi:hypothetical protein